jgi:hypothetical protein
MGVSRHASLPAAAKSGVGARVRRGEESPRNNEARKLRTYRPALLQFRWAAAISDAEWAIYQEAIQAIRQAKVSFLLGGGFALATFTGRWRDTKDIDFYVRREDRDAVVAALTKAGFADYYDQRPYDRKWIHRTIKSGVIVDIIWAMANQRSEVDDGWFERAGTVKVRDERLRVVPMEEFMWCKLYIMQRDHCDWTDLLNLLYANGQRIRWGHLINRLEDDKPLLKALLTIYSWLCPARAVRLPGKLWDELDLPRPNSPARRPSRDRIRLLDTRYWFAALKSGKKLEV